MKGNTFKEPRKKKDPPSREPCERCGNFRRPYKAKGSKFEWASAVLRIDGLVLRVCGHCAKTLGVYVGVEKVG